MLVSEVVAAIQQRSNTTLEPAALLREITQVRDRILRTPGGGQQQSEVVPTAFDLEIGRAVYPLPCPPSAIVDVAINDYDYAYVGEDDYNGTVTTLDRGWYRLTRKQFDQREGGRPYYYVTGGNIGLSRKPVNNVAGGIKIFHYPVLMPLTVNDLAADSATGIDPNFDMLLVYGTLQQIKTGAEAAEYAAKYQEIYDQYVSATNGFETYRVKRRWF